LLLAACFAAKRLPMRPGEGRLSGNVPEPAAVMIALGKHDAAISALERAVAQPQALAERADAFNDLSALYLDRGKKRGLQDAVRAAEMAERAWTMRRTPEIAWNRALAHEALHIRAAALMAWNDYLALDSDSSWSGEARAHIRKLSVPAQSRRWRAASAGLAASNGNHAYDELVRDFPQEMRSYAEETLLAEWAAGRGSLDAARSIGAVLQRQHDECLVADSIATIDSAGPAQQRRLAALHARYTAARQLFVSQQPVAAAAELSDVSRLFAAESSAFAFRAALYAATARYYAGALDEAERDLQRILVETERSRNRYPSLIGQIQWVRGLIHLTRGENNEAFTAYTAALAAFEGAGEAENRAAIESLLAERHRNVGREADGWSYLEQSLRSLDSLGRTRRSHAILTEAAGAAAQKECPLAALLFQDNLVTIAWSTNDAVSICDALITRSRLAAAAGRRALAETDLAEARRRMAEVKDPAMRTRTRLNLGAAEAAVWRRFDPARAARAAGTAIAEAVALGHRVRMVEMQLEAGRALAAVRRDDAALQSWGEGIGECERSRANLSQEDERRTYFEQCRALFDESIAMLMRKRRVREAFARADEARARVLRDLVHGTDAAPGAIPSGVTVVSYWLLPEGLVTWTLDAAGLAGSIRPLDRQALAKAAATMAGTQSTRTEFDDASSAVYDLLIRPIAPRLAPRVIFVPDADVYRLPLSGLRNRRTGRYLVEDHEISISPSIALLELSRMPWQVPKTVLLIDAARGAAEAVLPAAEREIRDVGAMYRRATIVDPRVMAKPALLQRMQSGDILHFAGHGRYADGLIDPALILRTGADPVLLYPADIATLSLRTTPLVILGGCGTAAGRIGTEGPLSVARAFVAARAQRVVAALWSVGDRDAGVLLTRFHRSISTGADPVQALRAVQMEAIRNYTAPREWAALEILQRTI
jgi:hypothetical protein